MEVRGVTFAYGKNEVLRDISLKIAEGKITTVIGANGCGKSTLFSLMTKNLYPKSGQIFLRSRNINNLNLKEFAQKAAIVHQYNTVSDDITVEQLVSFGRTPHKKMMAHPVKKMNGALNGRWRLPMSRNTVTGKLHGCPAVRNNVYGLLWHWHKTPGYSF